MIRKTIAIILLNITLLGTGYAQDMPSFAVLVQKFTCPSGTCQTKCSGPNGSLTVSANTLRVVVFSTEPHRLWLIADGEYYVLGDEDRCQFSGDSLPLTYAAPGDAGAAPSSMLPDGWSTNIPATGPLPNSRFSPTNPE
jgi:hypothetical protein